MITLMNRLSLKKEITVPHDKSTEFGLCKRAERLLAQAEADNYNSPDMLNKAFSLYVEASQVNSTFADSYYGLAKCLTLQGRFAEAKENILWFLKLSPGNELGFQLLHFLENEAQDLSETSINDLSHEMPTEQLYDLTLEAIQNKVKQMMEQPIPPMGLTESSWQVYEQSYENLESDLEKLHDQTAYLSEFVDVVPIWQQIKPLEQIRDRYQKAFYSMLDIESLLEALDDLGAELQLAFQRLPALIDIKGAQKQLDRFFDRFDAIADALDTLDAQGINISSLLELYKLLMKYLENYSEVFNPL